MKDYRIDKLWNKADTCIDEIHNINKIITENSKYDLDSHSELKKVYTLVKKIIPELYIDNKMHDSYEYIRRALLDCEYSLPNKTIVDVKVDIDIFKSDIISDFSEPSVILDWIVFMERKRLILEHSLNIEHPVDINRLYFENECQKSSYEVNMLCNSIGIQSEIVSIYPGYCESKKLFNGNGFHFFNLITIHDKKYIVDCTYKQFFTLRQNNLDRLGIVMVANCKPGIYMLIDESREKTAEKLLSDGWIEFDCENVKNYFDGFTLSFRNGLYYEGMNDFGYATDYDKSDYINFLLGVDNQLNYESEECLGFQKRPLI